MKEALKYICNPEKTNNGQMTFGKGCPPEYEAAYDSFQFVKQDFGKLDGRLAYHWEISFAPGETYPQQAMEIAKEWADEILGDDFQCLITVHDDKEHIHAHLIFNSVSMIDGHKFRYELNDLEQTYYPALNRLCVARGLSYVDLENPEGEKVQHISYKEWLMQKKGYATWKDMIKADIDHAIGLSYNFEKFISHLEGMGYDVNLYGKYLKVRVLGMEKWSRLYSLGKDYSEERIRERIRKSKLPEDSFDGIKKIYRTRHKIRRQRTPLTLFQRHYFRYMYLLGKVKRQPYRRITFAERQQSLRIAEQMNYIFFHRIDRISELPKRRDSIELEIMRNGEQRRILLAEQKKYGELFSHAKEYRLSDNTNSIHAEWLEKKGYVGDEGLKRIGDMKEALTTKILSLREQRKELEKEKKMIDGILNDYSKMAGSIVDYEMELGVDGRDHITTKEWQIRNSIDHQR